MNTSHVSVMVALFRLHDHTWITLIVILAKNILTFSYISYQNHYIDNTAQLWSFETGERVPSVRTRQPVFSMLPVYMLCMLFQGEAYGNVSQIKAASCNSSRERSSSLLIAKIIGNAAARGGRA